MNNLVRRGQQVDQAKPIDDQTSGTQFFDDDMYVGARGLVRSNRPDHARLDPVGEAVVFHDRTPAGWTEVVAHYFLPARKGKPISGACKTFVTRKRIRNKALLDQVDLVSCNDLMSPFCLRRDLVIFTQEFHWLFGRSTIGTVASSAWTTSSKPIETHCVDHVDLITDRARQGAWSCGMLQKGWQSHA